MASVLIRTVDNYNNQKSSKIREFIKINFLSSPLKETVEGGEKTLDLGCGWGFYFKINPSAVGIEIDGDCVNYLKSRGRNIVCGDIAGTLPFKDNAFRWVVAHDVLEHFEIEDAKKIISEVLRILEPGGKFMILSPNKKGYLSGLKRSVGHKHFITFKEISDISYGNFVIEKHFYHPLPESVSEFFTHNKEITVLKKPEGIT